MSNVGCMVARADNFCAAFKQTLNCSETVRGRGLYVELNWMQKELGGLPYAERRKGQTFADL